MLHAQAEARRAQKEIQIYKNYLHDKDQAGIKLYASYQTTIEGLKEQLAVNADSQKQHAAEAHRLNQQHEAQIQQMQAEHNQKIAQASDSAQKLLAETRAEDGRKVQAAQQAEQIAKREATNSQQENTKLREENKQKSQLIEQKDQEIVYLKKEIQNKSKQLTEVQRAPEPQKWTPHMQPQASPKAFRTPTRQAENHST
jgi:L-rhamnose mutarotase